MTKTKETHAEREARDAGYAEGKSGKPSREDEFVLPHLRTQYITGWDTGRETFDGRGRNYR